MKHCPHCGGELPVVDTKPKLTLDDRFWFGKYNGELIRKILADDPQYLFWAIQKVDDFNVSDELRADARRAAGNQKAKNHYPRPTYSQHHSDYDCDWGDEYLSDDVPF